MAGFENSVWLQRLVCNAAVAESADVSAAALGTLAEALSALPRSQRRDDLLVGLLADRSVSYASAAVAFAAAAPASAAVTAAFLARSDVPAPVVAGVLSTERRMSVLLEAASLEGRDPAVYDAVVAAFGTAAPKATPNTVFTALTALLTNPDVPLLTKAAALSVPSATAWARCYIAGDRADICWAALRSSQTLHTAAFDGLDLPGFLLLCCSSWQGLSTVQLRTVFDCARRHAFCVSDSSAPPTPNSPAFSDLVSSGMLLGSLSELCEHPAATAEFLSDIDDWFETSGFDSGEALTGFFRFAHSVASRRDRLRKRADPAEFWASHPVGGLDELTSREWLHWVRLGSLTDLVSVLADEPDEQYFTSSWASWLVEPMAPMVAAESADELLAGLAAAAAAGIPDVLKVVEELVWWSASYGALTFDVLRRLRLHRTDENDPPYLVSPTAAVRLLELLAVTLGSAPDLWAVFDTVAVPDAQVGEILDLALLAVEGGPG